MRIELTGVLEDGTPRRAGVPTDARANINFLKGSDAEIIVTVVTPGGDPVDLTGAFTEILLTVKKRPEEDPPRIARAASSVAGNRATFIFVPADTRRLDAGLYTYDVWLTKGGARNSVIPLSPFQLLDTAAAVPFTGAPPPAPPGPTPVGGPGSSTDSAIALWDGVNGDLLKNSLVTVDGAGNITLPGTVDGRDVSADGALLDAHIPDVTNPHAVTAAQVGSSTAQWNADKLQGLDISTATPSASDVLTWDGAEWKPAAVTASAGGSDKQVQFNDGGALAGAAEMTWDKTAKILALTGADLTVGGQLLSPGAGASSFKAGTNAIAAGGGSIAIGVNSLAAADWAVAFINSQALAPFSIAAGFSSEVQAGANGGIAFGYNTTVSASALYGLALGYNASVSGVGGTALGFGTQSAAGAFAMGNQTKALTGNAIAIGRFALADTSTQCIAMGTSAHASGNGAICFGELSVASAIASFALGYKAEAQAGGSVAIGSQAIASAIVAFAFGNNADATHSYSMAFGQSAASTAANRCTFGDPTLTYPMDLQITRGLAVFNQTPPTTRPAITGSRSGATVSVLTQLLTALHATGIIDDQTIA